LVKRAENESYIRKQAGNTVSTGGLGLLVAGSVWSLWCYKVQVRCRDIWCHLQSRYNSTYWWQARSVY